MDFTYWYMFPIAVVIAILANSSGFSGGVLFQPVINLGLNLPIANSVATGIATETVGMTSGASRLVLIMLVIPGVVVGNHALVIIDSNLLRLLLGFVLIFLAGAQLLSVARNHYGSKRDIPVEAVFPYMWIPPLGGFFSAATGTGMAETSQPLLERKMGLETRRANATAIWVEATGDWIITILNIQTGLILWNLLIFTGSGVIIGGQIGPYVAKFLPERLLKIVFSVGIIIIGVFYIYKGGMWAVKLLLG
jgi:uncharacterized protein